MKRILIVILLLSSGCIFQDNAPDIEITIDELPEELIVSDTHDFDITLTNEGSASAHQVTLESNVPPLLTFEEVEISEIREGYAKKVRATLVAADILKETREFDTIEVVIRVKYFDAEDNQKTSKTTFKFTLRKPKVKIEEVEAGLLPGKITIEENKSVPISIYIKNEENRRMEDLYIIFCSEYENVTIYRIEIEESEGCFEYAIKDVLWLNDSLSKGFTMEASLPSGAREVSFVMFIKLVWKTGDYQVILDVKELKVEVSD